MKRITVGLPGKLEKKLIELRKTDKYCTKSYADIIRDLMEKGISSMGDNQHITPNI